jgi:undecaprenyl-diphosphatase
MLRWDRHLESWIASHRIGALNPYVRHLTEAGNAGAIWLVLGLAFAVYLRRWQIFAWVAVADGLAQFSNALIQSAVGRQRPQVHTLIGVPTSHSFPSGHAASSLACVTVLAAFAPRFRIPLYVLAALVALSRLYVGVHYPLDVLGGAAWGLLVGKAVVDLKDSRPSFPSRRATGLRRLARGRPQSRPGQRRG